MRNTLIILAIIFSSCATTSTHSSQNTTQTQDFNKDAKMIYRTAIQTAMELNWEITMKDSEILAFSAKTPKIMSRWDDDVNVFVVEKDSSCTLTVKSNLGHSPNVEYVKSYIELVTNKLK